MERDGNHRRVQNCPRAIINWCNCIIVSIWSSLHQLVISVTLAQVAEPWRARHLWENLEVPKSWIWQPKIFCFQIQEAKPQWWWVTQTRKRKRRQNHLWYTKVQKPSQCQTNLICILSDESRITGKNPKLTISVANSYRVSKAKEQTLLNQKERWVHNNYQYLMISHKHLITNFRMLVTAARGISSSTPKTIRSKKGYLMFQK